MANYLSVKRSLELYQKAGELIPGWTQLISRRADQFAFGVSPIYAKHAKGSRFTDVDGNEYLDWVNAVGAIILGHADDVVDNAVIEQIRKGSIYTVNSPLELELAEELNVTIPSSQMVRYTKAGGEACSVAARIARGTTGRDLILFSGYHGWTDWYQAANFGVDPESGEYPFAGIEPIGIPKVLEGTAIPFSYGDLDGLEQLLKKHQGNVAAIMNGTYAELSCRQRVIWKLSKPSPKRMMSSSFLMKSLAGFAWRLAVCRNTWALSLT